MHLFLLSLPSCKNNPARAASSHKGNMLWHPSGPRAPNLVKSWCRGLSSSPLLFFWPTHQRAGCVLAANETLAVNRPPRQKRPHHPAPGAPGTVLFSSRSPGWQPQCTHARARARQPRSKLSLRRAPSELSQRRRDAEVLPRNHPDVSNPLGFSLPPATPSSSPRSRHPPDGAQNA